MWGTKAKRWVRLNDGGYKKEVGSSPWRPLELITGKKIDRSCWYSVTA